MLWNSALASIARNIMLHPSVEERTAWQMCALCGWLGRSASVRKASSSPGVVSIGRTTIGWRASDTVLTARTPTLFRRRRLVGGDCAVDAAAAGVRLARCAIDRSDEASESARRGDVATLTRNTSALTHLFTRHPDIMIYGHECTQCTHKWFDIWAGRHTSTLVLGQRMHYAMCMMYKWPIFEDILSGYFFRLCVRLRVCVVMTPSVCTWQIILYVLVIQHNLNVKFRV